MGVKKLLISVLGVSFVGVGSPADDPGLNARQAAILCGIYNAAANPPKTVYKPEEVSKIMSDIDAINASLSPEPWFSEIDAASDKTKLSEKFQAQNGDIPSYWQRWKEAVRRVNSPSSAYPRLSVDSPTAKIAQITMKKIEKQMEKIIQEIKEKNESAKVDEIKQKFDRAIGEEGKVVFKGSSRPEACGKTTGTVGTDAGKNLILDFICLCAYEAPTHGEGKTCFGDGVTIKESNEAFNTFKNKADSIEKMWKLVKTECQRQHHPPTAQAATLHRALIDFFQELNSHKGATVTNAKIGVLGSIEGNGSTGCNGQYNSAGGICVMYSTTAKKNDYQIAWYNEIKDVPGLIEKAENATVTIQNDIARLKMLRTRAEEIYNEVQATSELEQTPHTQHSKGQNHTKNPVTPANGGTSQEVASVNSVTILRFTLPWTLLL